MNYDDKSFVFYGSFYEQIKDLPRDMAANIILAAAKYGITGEVDELSAIEKAIFVPMRVSIDNAKKRYNEAVENGKKGGRPKKDSFSEEKPETKNPFENKKGGVLKEKRGGFENENPYEYEYEYEYEYDINKSEKTGTKPENPPKAETDKPSKKENHYKIFFETEIKKEFEEPIRDWINYKKSKKQGYPNLKSLIKMQDELIKCGGFTVSGVRAVVDSAIAKGYNGFFALRNPPPDVGQSDYNAEYINNIDWSEFDIRNDEGDGKW